MAEKENYYMQQLGGLLENGIVLDDSKGQRRKSSLFEDFEDNPIETSEPFPSEALRIHTIVEQIKAPASTEELEVNLRKMRDLLMEEPTPIEQVLNHNILPYLKSFLSDESLSSRVTILETLWILTNIISGSREQAAQVVEANILPFIIKNISHPFYGDIVAQAIWALGSIAADSAELRDIVLSQDILPTLITIANDHTNKLDVLRNVFWALSVLCCHSPPPPFYMVEPLIQVFSTILPTYDNTIKADALWGLCYIMGENKVQIQKVIEAGVIPYVLQALESSLQIHILPALRLVGQIVTGNDSQTQLLLNYGLLTQLHNLISNSTKKQVLKETCWCISNITAGNNTQIQAVIHSGIMELLPELMYEDVNINIKKEALKAIANAASKSTREQKIQMVQERMGIIAAVVFMMMEHSDEQILEFALSSLESVSKRFDKRKEDRQITMKKRKRKTKTKKR